MSVPSLTARTLATWFATGFAPKAPGTVGSLGAVPLHWLLRRASPMGHLAVVVVTTAAGIWAAQRESDRCGLEDPQHVVIDEVAGVLIAMGLVRNQSLARQVVALVLFRLFDIWKPGLIGRAEKAKPAGLGIMLDDLVAGAAAGLVARILP